MRRIHLSVALVGALALVAALVGTPRASRAITLIPPSMEFDTNKGDTITTKVKLFNETADPQTYYSSTTSIRSMDEAGIPVFVDEAQKADLATWVTLAPGPFTLQPGERKEISVEIKVPIDADPGGHYAAIFFSPQTPEAATPGEVAITTKITSLVLVRVAGAINESGIISQFTTSTGKTSFNRLPIEFILRFQNQGNVHLRPTGNITVRNMLGGTTTVLPLNATQGAVLPGTVRKFASTWTKEELDSKTNFFKEFTNEWTNFALGPYTANVLLTYGQSNDRSVTATLRFWVMPWRVTILTLILLIVVIWLIVLILKRYNRWIIERASGSSKPPATPPKK